MKRIIAICIAAIILASFIVIAFSAGETNQQIFSDVPISSQYYNAAQFCYNKGIVNGTGNGMFSPENKITVHQLCLIITRALQIKTDKPVEDLYELNIIDLSSKLYPDSVICRNTLCEILFKAFRIETYGKNTMDAAQELGLCINNSNKFDIMTRGEAIEIVYILMTTNEEIKKPEKLKNVNIVNNDKAHLDSYYSILNLVPDEIIQKFVDNKWKIIIDASVVNDFSKEIGASGMCEAFTDYKNKEIYIMIPMSMIHEIGHFVDCYMNDNNKLIQIFEKEGRSNTFLSFYSRTNYREYFAEAFDFYIRNMNNEVKMNDFKQKLPITSEYLINLNLNGWKKIV